MIEYIAYDILMWTEIGFAVLVFFLLFFINAPYGKHFKESWKPLISSRAAWLIMELPAVLVMPIIFFKNLSEQGVVTSIFLFIWLSHYFYRSLIYPFRTNNPNKKFPIVVAMMGFIFNLLNGWLNGIFLFELRVVDDISWLWSLPFLCGLIFFTSGYVINKQSEEILRSLKRNDPDHYQIPKGGVFELVSNPHYFGELLEWLGWAVLTWSSAGFTFFIFTFANLFPRAIANHKWYKKNFENYPKRKAIIPFVI